jgi:hypothetical protein
VRRHCKNGLDVARADIDRIHRSIYRIKSLFLSIVRS